MCAIWRREIIGMFSKRPPTGSAESAGRKTRFAGNAAIPRTVGASARATACWFTACHRTPVSAGQGTGAHASRAPEHRSTKAGV